jgi:hypothetical protein
MTYSPNRRENSVALGRYRTASFKMPSAFNDHYLQGIMNGSSSLHKMIIKMIKVDFSINGSTRHVVGDAPGIIRVHKMGTIVGTNIGTKVPKDNVSISDSNIIVYNGNASDGASNSGSPAPNYTNITECVAQEFAPRLFATTAIGYEMFDSIELLEGANIVVRPGESILVAHHGAPALAGLSLSTIIEWYEVLNDTPVDVDYKALE